jgi:hypothetical protein
MMNNAPHDGAFFMALSPLNVEFVDVVPATVGASNLYPRLLFTSLCISK